MTYRYHVHLLYVSMCRQILGERAKGYSLARIARNGCGVGVEVGWAVEEKVRDGMARTRDTGERRGRHFFSPFGTIVQFSRQQGWMQATNPKPSCSHFSFSSAKFVFSCTVFSVAAKVWMRIVKVARPKLKGVIWTTFNYGKKEEKRGEKRNKE